MRVKILTVKMTVKVVYTEEDFDDNPEAFEAFRPEEMTRGEIVNELHDLWPKTYEMLDHADIQLTCKEDTT